MEKTTLLSAKDSSAVCAYCEKHAFYGIILKKTSKITNQIRGIMGYIRKQKEKLPVVALCYDFDKTLTPDDMQAQGYIQDVGWDVESFWARAKELAEKNNMDQNLAYMYLMVKEAEGNLILNKKNLQEYGAKVKLYPGVREWFARIKEYGKQRDVIVEHYIISSGLYEMIEGTEMARRGDFERIYASSFLFNERNVAVWPAQAINYTNKTQFLFRISKGTLDVNDPAVNDYVKPENIRVPFSNIIYIGDSDTDIPCMRLVNANGGHSIGVYDHEKKDKTKVYKMIKENRIKYFAPADYREGQELDTLVKSIIDKIAADTVLINKTNTDRHEQQKADKAAEIAKTLMKSIELESASNGKTLRELIDAEHRNNKNIDKILKLFGEDGKDK